MFIYKITNIENNLCYIGFDTYPEYKQKRWNEHQKNCLTLDSKFYVALRDNIDKFVFEIIDEAEDIMSLVFKEIKWIDHYDSYKNGYNSTRGGDGLNQDLSKFTNEEIENLKFFYSLTMTEYNTNVKWKDKTPEERKELTAHLHNETVYKKKSETLKSFYESNPDIRQAKGRVIRDYWNSLSESEKTARNNSNQENALKGAASVSKRIKIEFQDGSTKIYNSKSEFNREHGEIINGILRKTKENKSHRGFKGWEI